MASEDVLRARVRQQLEKDPAMPDERLWELIDRILLESDDGGYRPMREKRRLRRVLFHAYRGMDILEDLMEDPTVTEIMVNGYDRIFLEREGQICPWDRAFADEKQLMDVIRRTISPTNRVVNRLQPIADARLKDGSRMHVVLPPASIDGPCVTIRKFTGGPLTLEDMVEAGSLSREAADFLIRAVREKHSVFISGGTGSGKTTFLGALSEYIPSGERVITIEDSAELRLRSLPNLVRLEARMNTAAGGNEITIRDLLKASLRMRPDRIIVGEVRSGECLDMLQAMNTGHEGSLSTGHANSPRDALSRLETMALMGGDLPLAAIRSQIASALRYLVHLARGADGARRVTTIAETDGMEGGEIRLKILFSRGADGVLRREEEA